MGKIIASTYEITEKIGSGGAGIVYLGRHLRLDKPVVLKADKRSLSTKPEKLRREVDALKNLSHTYIPQVYDFVEEDGTVYTIMDYIEGESLDKPLSRGECFSQAQVIEWACQLLEALSYLHSRPPHGILHSDIKPANIMLTPQNDIRLIDFNIALALGEEGTVQVGYSRGYASPEHYGLDYTHHGDMADTGHTDLVEGTTEMLDGATELVDGTTELVSASQALHPASSSSGSTGSSGKRKRLLDVRSDIYSAGATLYHLLTGVRPQQDAREVPAITDPQVSSAVAAIIQKAMAPDPDERYQTAQEMLDAFRRLHDDDPRARRHKRAAAITVAVLTAVFLAGVVCTIVGLNEISASAIEAEDIARQEENAAREREEAERLAREAAEAAEEVERREKQAVALVADSSSALGSGDTGTAVRYAAEALLLDTAYNAPAQKALTDALNVYDLSDGFKAQGVVELPSKALDAILSPDGTRLCALYSWELAVYDTATGERLAALPLEPSALSEAEFLDENRMVYAGPDAIRAYDIGAGTELWSGEVATQIAVSADGSRVAGVYKDATEAFVYDAATGEMIKNISFDGKHQRVPANDILANPKNNLLALNADGTKLAISFSDGTLTVYDLVNPEDDLELLDPGDYVRFEGGFSGKYFAFSAFTSANGGDSVMMIIDTERMRVGASAALQTPFHLQLDESGIYVSNDSVVTKFDMENSQQIEMAYTEKDITAFHHAGNYTVAVTEDNQFYFFDRTAGELATDQTQAGYSCDFADLAGGTAVVGSLDSPILRLLRLENHADAEIFSYDPSYRHSEARVSADGATVMLFRYTDFRLYGIGGELLAEVEIPDADQVRDQQYRRENGESWLEVIYADGLVRSYSAADGALLSEEQGEAPGEDLYEEFFTDKLRIEAPLNDTVKAYDRESGEPLAAWDDANIAYVTQVGDYVVVEFVTTKTGDRYGLLLDENCEALARLPKLCDIVDGELIFDESGGNLRKSKIYTAEELLALAEEYQGGTER